MAVDGAEMGGEEKKAVSAQGSPRGGQVAAPRAAHTTGEAATYASLFVSSLFVNKYVLSGLGFTYPTVFQGWQMLVGAAVFKSLTFKCCASRDLGLPLVVPTIGWRSFLAHSLMRGILFACAAVAGSKALSGVPVSCVVAASNSVRAALYILERWGRWTPGPALAAIATLATCAYALTMDGLPMGERPLFWLLTFAVLHSADLLYTQHVLCPWAGPGPLVHLYYAYITSVVLLAPCSLYLEEAFLALSFKAERQMVFYAMCTLSGALGAALGLWECGGISLWQEQGWLDPRWTQFGARFAAWSLSVGIGYWYQGRPVGGFTTSLPLVANLLLGANVIASFWVPSYPPPVLDVAKPRLPSAAPFVT